MHFALSREAANSSLQRRGPSRRIEGSRDERPRQSAEGSEVPHSYAFLGLEDMIGPWAPETSFPHLSRQQEQISVTCPRRPGGTAVACAVP